MFGAERSALPCIPLFASRQQPAAHSAALLSPLPPMRVAISCFAVSCQPGVSNDEGSLVQRVAPTGVAHTQGLPSTLPRKCQSSLDVAFLISSGARLHMNGYCMQCTKCGGVMEREEKDTSSGRDMRTYICSTCKQR